MDRPWIIIADVEAALQMSRQRFHREVTDIVARRSGALHGRIHCLGRAFRRDVTRRCACS
jgi:hypothetical protein